MKILKKAFKVLAWITGSILFLLVVVALLIQLPAVQTWLTKKAVTFLEEKIGTEVSLGGIAIGFPKSIVLKGIYLEDQGGDTLLYAKRLSVDTDLWALTRNEVQLNDVTLQTTVAFVNRVEGDSAFNFTYILDAFAGDSTAVPDTLEQKGWNITLESLQLEDIRVRFDDRLQGNLLELSLGNFELNMRTFDLENNAFAIEDVILENTRGSFVQSKMPAPTAATAQAEDSVAALVLSLDELAINNVALRYAHTLLGQEIKVSLGEIEVVADNIDLVRQHVLLTRVTVNNSTFALHSSKKENPDSDNRPGEDVTKEEATPWTVSVDQLRFADNTVEHTDMTQPALKDGIDFNHLLVKDLVLEADDIFYNGNNIRADVGKFAFREKSGFRLASLSGKVNVAEQNATVENLLLITDNSRLELDARSAYPSFTSIGEQWQQANVDATLDDSYINVRDILYLNPALADSLPVNLPIDTDLHIDAAVQGRIADLRIRHLNFRSFTDTYLNTSGRVTGLPDANKLTLDLTIDRLRTTRADLQTILPDTLLPDSIQLPSWMELKARYTGSLTKANFDAALSSDAGLVEAGGNMNLDSTSSERGLRVSLDVTDFDVGSILGKADSVMGTLTMRAKVETKGLALEEMDGQVLATVDHFDFQRYRYRNLHLEGTVREGIADLAAYMEDENLDFTFGAQYTIGEEVPRYDFTFDLKNADFQALHLSTSPIRARGILEVDMATADFKVLNGGVGIRQVAVFNGDDLYAVDSLLFASIDQEGRSEINIDSDLLEARFEGSINIFGLPSVLREYFHTYYALHDSLEVKDAPPQRFTFEIQLRNTDLLTDLLVPQLTTFDPGPIKGAFDSQSKNLEVSMAIDAIQYGNIGIKSFAFTTESDADDLRYDLEIDKILIDSTRIDGLAFNGTVADNRINTQLTILDSTDREKYILAATLLSLDKGFEMRLAPTGTVLNYQQWSAPRDNLMRFGGEKFVAQNVELTNLREKIIIRSDEKPGTPITIGFRELNLEYLTSMVAEERPASGLLQGDVNLYPSTDGLTFTSDLTVNNFRIKDIPWGNIALQVSQTQKDRFDVDFRLKGDHNSISIAGFYSGGKTPSLDVTGTVDRFDLQSLQPLLANQVRDLKGLLKGKITVKNTPQRPDIDGGLVLQNTAFFSNFLNTAFSIDNQTISFVDEGIAFDKFQVADQAGHKAMLDGTILTRNYQDFQFRLDLVTNNFRLLDTKEGDNDLFYGRIDMEANAKIRGNTTTPVVDVDIAMADGSNLTYIVPQSEASILQSEGIVKFVDRSFQGDPFMKQVEGEVSDTIKSTFKGIDLTARIELTDQETFTIIIDPLTKDQLSVRGNTTLTLQMDPTGDMNLTGRFEIEEGTYNLSFYKFVKREFQIDPGSSITWLGDPLNAQMDIRAIYNIETSPIELFSNQLPTDPNQANQYKQRLPFMVYLNLTGELLEPEIAFKLEMPESERSAFGGNVYARLQDINTRESDLNKQVFALLILKRFISDDPFENKGGGGFESTARTSVSKILSEQLNRLSENIKGVELSFDIKSYEDYTSGQAQGQTELELGVSKSLLNDRLVVKLSGNIDIEGQNANRDATDYIGDLALEYKITPDGRFRITGFRNSNYDMIDGELIETGAGLIYIKDYNALSELFKANAEKN